MVVSPTPKESPATLRDQELSLRDIASRLVISKGNGRVGLPGRSDYWTVELIISKFHRPSPVKQTCSYRVPGPHTGKGMRAQAAVEISTR
jgi:hypothetical protein